MDRKPLYAQFDGDEVDGKRYALGEELATDTDPGTTAYLTTTGRFASNKPGDEEAVPVDSDRSVTTMSRSELLSELGDGQDDATLRDAVERKREVDKERQADDRERIAADEENDPLGGNADKAIEYVGTLDDRAALDALKGREQNGKGRTTILAAIDKRIEALKPAE